jgi:hypothetical protein
VAARRRSAWEFECSEGPDRCIDLWPMLVQERVDLVVSRIELGGAGGVAVLEVQAADRENANNEVGVERYVAEECREGSDGAT